MRCALTVSGGSHAPCEAGNFEAMELALFLPILLLSIVVHEVAHAWQARREGDDTAYRLGRITLNPVSHLDPVGSILVPMVLFLSGSGFLFGWAKPVPVNPANYREHVAGDIRVSLAGIVSNLILAAGFTLLAALLAAVGTESEVMARLLWAARMGIFFNLILAFFNLIPVPPLDGSHVLFHVLPESARPAYRNFGRFGFLALIAGFYLIPQLFSILLWPVSQLMDLAQLFIDLWA